VRGASALGEALDRHPEANVRVLVIWLPVILTDLGPPKEKVRLPLQDPRVIEFWDRHLWASPRMMKRAAALMRAKGEEVEFGPDDIAWDVIGLFPAGVVWEDPFPTPTWYDGPVADVLEPVDRFLSEAR
jgi:hypothetical protein